MPLVEMLNDEWVNVRIYAVQSLGKLGFGDAVPALVTTLEDADENILVRSGAASALGQIKDARALVPLRALIMGANELGEVEDMALKSYKIIMAANWKQVPTAKAAK
jgi:HEAT repeat protein